MVKGIRSILAKRLMSIFGTAEYGILLFLTNFNIVYFL